MSKKLLILTIVLMTLALTGIIWVQLFWINNAIKVREAEFDNNVNDALQAAVRKLDKRRQFIFLNQSVDSIKSKVRIDLIDSATDSVFFRRDSLRFQLPDSLDINLPNIGAIISSSLPKDKEKVAKKLDSLAGSVSESININIRSISDSLNMIIREEITEVNMQAKKIREALQEMETEISIFRMDDEKGIFDQVIIDSILSSHLADHGIRLPFEFTVIDKKAGDTLVKSPGYTEQGDLYNMNLLPNALIKKPQQLEVYFPGKRSHIIRSLSVMLGLSLFFTLFILLAFSVSLFIIFRQKRISEIKSDFINNMTHEFKTPIATISLATDSIANPSVSGSPEQLRYFLNVIREENQRMNAQVENVLNMSLIERKRIEHQIEKTDLHSVLAKAAENIEIQAEEKGGGVTTDFGAECFHAEVDPGNFRNAIDNLLDNAIKYNQNPPDVRIKTRSSGDAITIGIIDNGIGISAKDQKKIFDRFFRVGSGDVHDYKGFGLGLSYVREVIASYGGSVGVQSTPGEGSEFVIQLPCLKT